MSELPPEDDLTGVSLTDDQRAVDAMLRSVRPVATPQAERNALEVTVATSRLEAVWRRRRDRWRRATALLLIVCVGLGWYSRRPSQPVRIVTVERTPPEPQTPPLPTNRRAPDATAPTVWNLRQRLANPEPTTDVLAMTPSVPSSTADAERVPLTPRSSLDDLL